MFTYDGRAGTITVEPPPGLPDNAWEKSTFHTREASPDRKAASCWDGLAGYLDILNTRLVWLNSEVRKVKDSARLNEKLLDRLLLERQQLEIIIGRYQLVLSKRGEPVNGEVGYQLSKHHKALGKHRSAIKKLNNTNKQTRQACEQNEQRIEQLERRLDDLCRLKSRPAVSAGDARKRIPPLAEVSNNPTFIIDDDKPPPVPVAALAALDALGRKQSKGFGVKR